MHYIDPMQIAEHALSVNETLKQMRSMVEAHWRDMAPYVHLPITEAYENIKNIPWRADSIDGFDDEVVMRPSYTMFEMGVGGDCDDKAVMMASYLKAAGYPWRFVAVGDDKFEHVYVETQIDGQVVPLDATYPYNTFGLVRERRLKRYG